MIFDNICIYTQGSKKAGLLNNVALCFDCFYRDRFKGAFTVRLYSVCLMTEAGKFRLPICQLTYTEKNYVSISFHIEWDMIVVTVFLSISNQMEFHLVQNRKENCHHDHIPFNLKGNGNIVFSV